MHNYSSEKNKQTNSFFAIATRKQNKSTKKSNALKNQSLLQTLSFALLIGFSVYAFTGSLSAPIALLAGLVLAQFISPKVQLHTQKLAQKMLKICVVGLGFGIPLQQAMAVSGEGLLFTIGSISFTLILGTWLGKKFKVSADTSMLIAAGTAICGGSAIAAVAPVLNAKAKDITIALGTIFTLNAIALFLFPVVGHFFHLSQDNFGIWSAIAIHDTSSVVGAAKTYGAHALEVATVIKLERALWVVPIVFILSLKQKRTNKNLKLPWFILFFIIALLIKQYIPSYETTWSQLAILSRHGLVFTLLLIGTGLNYRQVKSVGLRPFLQGIILWVAIGSVSLFIILHH